MLTRTPSTADVLAQRQQPWTPVHRLPLTHRMCTSDDRPPVLSRCASPFSPPYLPNIGLSARVPALAGHALPALPGHAPPRRPRTAAAEVQTHSDDYGCASPIFPSSATSLRSSHLSTFLHHARYMPTSREQKGIGKNTHVARTRNCAPRVRQVRPSDPRSRHTASACLRTRRSNASSNRGARRQSAPPRSN